MYPKTNRKAFISLPLMAFLLNEKNGGQRCVCTDQHDPNNSALERLSARNVALSPNHASEVTRRPVKSVEVGLVLSCPVRQDSRQDKTSTSQDKKSCKTSCLVLRSHKTRQDRKTCSVAIKYTVVVCKTSLIFIPIPFWREEKN